MANDITFEQSIARAMAQSPCKARNTTGLLSTYSIVYGYVPVFGFGTMNSNFKGCGSGYEWIDDSATGTWYSDVWPNIYQTITAVYSDPTGSTTRVTTWGTYSDALGPSVNQYVSSGTGATGPQTGATITAAVINSTGTIATQTYTNASGLSGTYTATLSNQWFGAASLAAWWTALTAAATALLAEITPCPFAVTSCVITDPGTGYVGYNPSIGPGDYLIMQGGTVVSALASFVGNTPAAMRVTSVSGTGAITVFTLNGGLYTSPPSPFLNNTPTGGHGSGCTVNLGIGLINSVNAITNLSTTPGYEPGVAIEIILCAANGVPTRGTASINVYIDAATIIEYPSPFTNPAVVPNEGYCLSAKSTWQLNGATSQTSGGTAGQFNNIYQQSVTIGQPSTFASPTLYAGPYAWPIQLSFDPTMIAGYGLMAFKSASA